MHLLVHSTAFTSKEDAIEFMLAVHWLQDRQTKTVGQTAWRHHARARRRRYHRSIYCQTPTAMSPSSPSWITDDSFRRFRVDIASHVFLSGSGLAYDMGSSPLGHLLASMRHSFILLPHAARFACALNCAHSTSNFVAKYKYEFRCPHLWLICTTLHPRPICTILHPSAL